MKTILITGASGGIGSEIAKRLANREVKLNLVYFKNEDKVVQLQQELSTICPVDVHKCDLTNEKDIKNLVYNIILKDKHIDGLVNCAGVSLFEQIQDITLQDYAYILDNNVKSVVFLTSLVAKHMISTQAGKIVNISSMWGKVGASMESLYSASKGAINTFTLALAKELGPSNITVNAVCPGLIDTDMNKNLSTETIKDIVADTPLQRIGKPIDVANLVNFLLSKQADFITGQIITIDGGFSL